MLCMSRNTTVSSDCILKIRQLLLTSMKANFKIHDVSAWLTDNCNINIAQYLTK